MSAINNHHLAMSASSVAASMAPSSTTPNASAKAMTASTTATTGTGSSSSSTDNSDITSSDFLQLLVSELQNQDPTQPTDPDAYVQQLVGVNSLQQLISINQELA